MMAKPKTTAVITLESSDGLTIVINTLGTRAAPGLKIANYSIDWGDTTGEAKPAPYPPTFTHTYKEEGSYDIIWSIKDSKGNIDRCVLDNMLITRNPTNPVPPGLVITQITPLSGDVGALVTIIGYGFGNTQGSSTLTFDGTPATINAWSETLIRCIVPNIGAGTAIVLLTVGANSGQVQFEVTSSPIEIFDFYVSTSGNNSWNGLYPDNSLGGNNGPKRTFNGASGALALLSAGKSLGVRAGIYNEYIHSSPSGTSWSNKVRIANYNNEIVIVKPPSTSPDGVNIPLWLDGLFHYIEFDGINIDATLITNPGYCIWFSTNNFNDVHHIRYKNAEVTAPPMGGGGAIGLGSHRLFGQTGFCEIINCVIHGGGLTSPQCDPTQPFTCASYGVYIEGPNHLVENCDIYGVSGFAIQIFNSGGDSPDNNIVRNNRFHNITRSPYSDIVGILIAGGVNNWVYNNLMYELNHEVTTSAGYGVVLSGTSHKVFNNVITNNLTVGGVKVEGGSGHIVKNNIAYNNNGRPPYTLTAGSATVENNSWQFPVNGANPLFVNIAMDDFRLQTISPCLDQGQNLTTLQGQTQNPPLDFAGNPRPSSGPWDQGAYQQ